MKADLHIHTKASDGSATPQDVVKDAHGSGLAMMAVTDHDTISSVASAQATGEEFGLPVVSGIELSVAHDTELHILGYFMDIEHPKLLAYTEKTRLARDQRVVEYVNILQKKGLALDMDEIKAAANGGMLSRAHLAQALLAKGYVQTFEEAFTRYLGRTAETYIDKEKIGMQAALALIADCGGISVWAHPVYHMDEKFDDLLDDLLSCGLNGLEAYHPDHSDDMARKLDKLAQKKAMLVTCGSDYHGKAKPEVAIGSETRSSDYLNYCLELFYKKAIKENT